MEKIKIETTQNVELEYPLAGLGNRVAAYLIDAVFIVIYWFAAMLLLFTIASTELAEVSIIGILIALYLPVLFYHFLFETFNEGQSPGKKIMKIRVVKLDGTEATVGTYFMRWLLSLVDIFLTSGVVAVITVAVTEKSQRLGDMAAGTTVIKLKKDAEMYDTILMEDTDQDIRYPEVSKLDDDDVRLLKELIITARQQDLSDKVIDRFYKAKAHYEGKLGIKSNTEYPAAFFTALLKDYNKYHGRVW